MGYTTAKFDKTGKRISPAMMSVRHNGVLIHDKYVLPSVPSSAKYKAGEAGPLYLQDHGNPVHFRNIWVVEKN